MSAEFWLAVRDAIGERSSVDYENGPILIRNLPAGCYDILRHGTRIAEGIGPNIIPGALLNYCIKLADSGERFGRKSICLSDFPDIVTDLQLAVVPA